MKPRAARAPKPATPVEISLWVSAAVGLLAFVSYLAMAPPVSGDKDAAEWTLVLATGGVPHPTGYPLYTVIGHLFVRLLHALGAGWPYAANAWSAVGGGVAIGLMHALGARLLPPGTGRRAALAWPLLPVTLLALNPIWTVETTLAEVYGWHVSWCLGIACVFVVTIRDLERKAIDDAALLRRAILWGLLCGLGGAHHLTAIFVAVPLTAALLFVLASTRRLRATHLGAALGAMLVPLASYAWIAWRAFHPGGRMWSSLEPSLASVLDHITGRVYQQNVGRFQPSAVQKWLLSLYAYPYLAAGFAFLLGALVMARPRFGRVVMAALLVAALASAGFGFAYGVQDPSSYFLAPMALGLVALAPLGAWLSRRSPRVGAFAAGTGFVLAIILSVGWMRIDLERRRQFISFDRLVRQMWSAIPPGPGFVFWADDMYARLVQYQMLEGERPDLWVGHPITLTSPGGREKFQTSYGFDPLAGVDLRVPPPGSPLRQAAVTKILEEIEAGVNRQTPLPVVVFDPQKLSVRLLRKDADTTRAVR